MSNNAPDYENDLVFPPQEIKSQHEMSEQGRQSEVLVAAIEKCEKLEKKLEIAVNALNAIKQAIEFGFPKRGIRIDTPHTILLRAVEEKAQEALEKIKDKRND